MPTILQTVEGTVTGLWGSALIRGTDGKMRPLKVGDLVHRGDVILTTQNGIVQLTPEHGPETAKAPVPPGDDVDRVIADLNSPQPTDATAATLGGDGAGDLTPGLRVDRIVESTSPAALSSPVGETSASTSFTTTRTSIASASNGTTTSGFGDNETSIHAVEEGPPVNLGITLPGGASGTAVVSVTEVPAIGEIHLANGTVLTAGSALTAADLAGLTYTPPADYDGTSSVGHFGYTLNDNGNTGTGGTAIDLAAVNDAPVASAATVSGLEDAVLPVSLSGTDVDGTIVAVTVQSLPEQGTLFLSDGVTPVVAGQTLTAAQAAALVFVPNANFNGGDTILFTVTDDSGAVSAPATLGIVVTPVNDAPIALPDTATGLEDHVITGNVLSNDRDVEGDALTLTQFSIGTATFAAESTAILAGVGTLTMHGDGSYVFTPVADYNGSVPTVGYVVSDGVATSTSTLDMSLTPVVDLTTVTLGSSASTVTEGGSIVYTVTLDHPVRGSPFVVTLSNGHTITIPVGASSADSGPVAVRPDDGYVQGNETVSVGISGTTGGTFEALDTSEHRIDHRHRQRRRDRRHPDRLGRQRHRRRLHRLHGQREQRGHRRTAGRHALERPHHHDPGRRQQRRQRTRGGSS